MTTATTEKPRLTSDPVPADELRADVAQLFEAMAAGGIGIVPLDVAYAVVATTPGGIRRIFEAKQRSYDKPSGMFGSWRLSREVHRLDDRRHEMVRELVEEERIPFSVVAPFRAEHPLFAAVDPFVMQNSSKGGTLDMLINAGQFHGAIAEGAIARGNAVFGSSANLSLTGSKYRYADIDAPVREAAAIHFDYGQSKYAHKDGLASTIIDFVDFSVIRVGHCFDRLKQAFATALRRHAQDLSLENAMSNPMSDPYKDIGFDANRIGFGRRAGVVVVDFQKGFTESRFPLGGRPMVERAVNNTAQLLAAARKAGLPVASCYTAYSSARDAPLWKIPTVVNEFHHGHPCTELDERIYDRTYDMVVCKIGPSIFFNTPVATYFVKEGVDTVIVSGCNTSGCVRASINDAFSYGFRVIVPEPCCGDVDEGPHRDNLRDVGRRYADVVSLEEVLAYIETSGRRND